MENKLPEIHSLLSRLEGDLGENYFGITDHWEADLKAVGITKPGNPSVLVYLSINDDFKTYYAALELPSKSDVYEDA